MYNLEYYISLYIFFLCCFMFSFYYKHLMLMIISLEFIMIMMIYNMFIIMMNIEVMSYLMMFVLVFSVCEGSIILSLLVMLVRLCGNDYINSLMVLKW